MFKRIKLNLLLVLLLVLGSFSAAHAEAAYCSTVKIEILQELSLERQAFDAIMKINNGLDTLSIENVNISVNFSDENGLPVLATNDPNETNPDAKFFIRVDSMTGISDVTGTGVVAPATSAEIRWLIIPIPGSADGLPSGKLYFVGANLTYTLGGQQEEVNVIPDFITVMPLPQLELDYFLTEEVIGDDAFTTSIEAPEPYTLGVRIKNNGTGIANNIKIDSAQPRIVENEQGLLIDFKITGSSLNDQPALPTLLINFGTINPGEATVGRWIMETSLSGKFTEFTAKVTHADELGGDVTSIINSNDINTHFLLRDVRVDLPGRDFVRDFLGTPAGSTAGVLKVYESNTVDTDVNNASTGSTFIFSSSAGSEVNYSLTMPVVPGFNYARIPDPHNGQKIITGAVRSDGKLMLLDNVWTSKTRNRNTTPPSWEYWVNIFDVNTTGNYIVSMNDLFIGPQAPVIQVITDKVTFENNQVGFLVESSDPNGDSVFLSAKPLPAGATFIDNGNGTAFFNWTPTIGQAGTYLITYKATDSVLSSQRTATIKVNSASDTDGDGLDDAWEMEHFGTLDRDGTGDFDNDGISDLDEFLNGTDPNLLPPLAPGDMVGVPGNLQASFTWSSVSGATSYNLYWSETPNVTKELGFPIETINSPFTHTGLTNDTSYYYAISSVGSGGESALSAEVKVTPGNKNWGTPDAVENSIYDIFEYQIAYAGNGTGMAVWTENDTLRTNVWASLYTPNVGWGIPQLVEVSDTADASSIRVKMDDFGNAIAIWKQVEGATESLWSNTYSDAGAWGSAIQIISTGTGELGQAELILTNSGAAMVNWLQAISGQSQISQIWSSLLFANASAWNTAERIETIVDTEVSGLQLANDGSGNVMAVWSQTTNSGSSYDFVFNRFTNSQWGTESLIRSAMVGDVLSPVINPVLAVNQLGDATLAWTEVSIINSVMAMSYTIANGWDIATLIEFDDVNPAYDPAVALSDNGDAIVVWTQSSGTRDAIYSNRYQSAYGWEANTNAVSSLDTGDPVGIASLAKVEMDVVGNAVVVWQQMDSVQSNVWSNRYDLVSGWDGPIIIDYANDGNAINPVVAMDNSGNAITAWMHFDGVIRNLLFNDLTAQNTGMPNILPVVILPDSLTVNENDAVVIDGSASFDQDGFIALYEWSQISGTVVQLNGLYTHTLNFVAPALPAPETLVFRLIATDGDNAIATKDVAVVVNAQSNISPTVNVGVDQAANEQTTVTLAGVASDSDGSIATYAWTQTSGAVVTLTDVDTAIATFTSPLVLIQDGPQVLSFLLTVTDNNGGTATDTLNVTVNPVNTSPTVNAGVVQSVNEQTAVTLSGAANDSDGNIVSYAWTQTAGIPVILTGINTATASFTSPTVLVQDGTQLLGFTLTATDNEGAVVTDTVAVIVNPVNAIPTASAGLDQTVNEQTAVTLTGTAVDSDGSIASYAWTQTTGVPVTLVGTNTTTANFTAPVVLAQDGAQVLSFTLTATDNEGAVTTDAMTVTVNPVNVMPTVGAGVDQSVNEQTAVTLTGAANDADGNIASHTWTQTSGVPIPLTGANTTTATFTSPIVLTQDSAQVLSFTLTATDNEGSIISDSMTVTVNAVNAIPTVDAGLDQIVNEQTAVTLTGAANDADGNIASYAWTQTSGVPVPLTSANTATATFTSPIVLIQNGAQVLSFTLTVTDNEGSIISDSMIVTVNAVNAIPTIDAGLDQLIAEDTLVNLIATASDSDGAIASYTWTQLSGQTVVLTTAATANANFISPLVYQDTVLVFQVAVTDNEGSQIIGTVTVVVYSTNSDDDADGMDDLWEVGQFGDLTHDGNGDFDNDGFSDYQEYQRGTNPLVFTLPEPAGLKAVADNSQVTLSWMPVSGVVGYNLYWSTSPGVTTNNGILIQNVESGYIHMSLTNGTTYYYVITALSAGDESVVSVEASATPGIRAWNTSQRLDSALKNDLNPQIAVNARGNAVAIWSQFDGVVYSAWVSHRDPETGWNTAQAIETDNSGNIYSPQIAINDNGEAIAVWEQFDGVTYNVWSNHYDPQSGWGVAERIETNALDSGVYFYPQVAIDENGDAIVVWQKLSSGGFVSIWANRYSSSLGWQTAQTIETDELHRGYDPQVAMDAAGNALVVWRQSDGIHYNILSNRYNATSNDWSTATVINSSDLGNTYDVQIAMNSQGHAVAVWEQFDGTHFNIWSNYYNAVSGWGIADYIEHNTNGGNTYFYPQVAMDDHGNAVSVWQQRDGRKVGIWANRLVNGVWSSATVIEPINYAHSFNPQVAMDSDGNAVVVWEQRDHRRKYRKRSIWSNRYSIYDESWLQAHPLETNDAAKMLDPQVAIDDYGNAVTIWWSNAEIHSATNGLSASPPIANAGADQSGYARNIITLDGSGSYDQTGQSLSYHWHQLSGINVTLRRKNTATPIFRLPRKVRRVTRMEFILTVTNSDGISMIDTVVVTALP